MAGGGGMWLAYVDPANAPIEAEVTLGQELLGRTSRMTLSDVEKIRNVFTLNFAPSAGEDGEYTGSVTLDETNSAICYYSKQLLQNTARGDTGERADDPIDCDATRDASTAGRMLLAKADRLALPRRILGYELAPEVYWLRAGAAITLTDPGYGITTHRGVITKINRSMVQFTQHMAPCRSAGQRSSFRCSVITSLQRRT